MPSIIEEIATALHISSASVSRALNDRPGVSEALRERILAKARELNYTTSITARGLATQQTYGIGFFVHDKPGMPAHSDPFYGEILRAVEQASTQSPYHISVAMLTDDILARPSSFRFVRERRVDGMILAGPDIPNDFIVEMMQSDLPVVLVDNKLDHTPVNCVNSDDEGGAYNAAQYLINAGHRMIGVISGPREWSSNARRVRGYRRAIEQADLPFHVVHVDRTTIESGEAAYEQLAGQLPDMTALCAVNDSMAMGAIRAAQRMGTGVPEDLSVVGFDDIVWASLNAPPLTTMKIPRRQLGQEAFRRLVNLLDDGAVTPMETIVAVQLIERESTRRLVP